MLEYLLANIFSALYCASISPPSWKIANVMRIPEKDEENNPENLAFQGNGNHVKSSFYWRKAMISYGDMLAFLSER